jgi:hypothetical protein
MRTTQQHIAEFFPAWNAGGVVVEVGTHSSVGAGSHLLHPVAAGFQRGNSHRKVERNIYQDPAVALCLRRHDRKRRTKHSQQSE